MQEAAVKYIHYQTPKLAKISHLEHDCVRCKHGIAVFLFAVSAGASVVLSNYEKVYIINYMNLLSSILSISLLLIIKRSRRTLHFTFVGYHVEGLIGKACSVFIINIS